MAAYGNYAGPNSLAQFRVASDYQITAQSDTAFQFSVRYWVETTGNFYSTTLHTNWAGDVSLTSPGTYADTGWVDWGWQDYGTTIRVLPEAHYTGGSGAYYQSALDQTWAPPTPTWTPYAPTGAKHTRNSDGKNTVSWANNDVAARKYASLTVQRSVDGGSWANLKTGLSASTTSYADTTTSAGHSYAYRVAAVNSAGTSYSSGTSKTYNTPSAPTGVKSSRASDSRNNVSWKNNAPDPATYSSITVQRSVDGGAWANLATGLAGTSTSYADSSTSAGHSYAYRILAVNSSGTGTSASSGKTYNTPTAPSGVALTRNSDSKNTVSWKNNAPDPATYSSITVQRSVDGGAWANLKTGLAGTSTSYADTTTSAGHYYAYRILAVNSAGTSYSASSATSYNSPTAPTCSAARSGETSVVVTVGSISTTATGIEIQRQASGSSTWETVYSGSTSPATYTDEPGAGTWRYRARATRGSLASAWSSASGWATPMSPPGAPTIGSPASGATFATGARVRLSWTHNTTDGSAQSDCEVQRSEDGGQSWQAVSVGPEATYCDLTYSATADVMCRVRTAGVSGELGPWATVSFYVRVAPQVSVTANKVTSVPFEISWTCGQMSGSISTVALTITKVGEASPALSLSLGAVSSRRIGVSELIPQDGATYDVSVTVRSSYGLAGSGSARFGVAYEVPGVPSVTAEVDEGRGAVSLVASATAAAIGTDHMSVWREGLCLGEDLPTSCSVYDPLPPLDREVTYEVVAHAASGAVSRRTVGVTVPSRSFAFLNWGDDWSSVCRAAMNLAPSRSTQRESETMEVFGRRRPVCMYGEHVSAIGSLTADVWWIADEGADGPEAMLSAWDEAAEHAGDYALRLPMSEPVRVRGDITASRGDVFGVATVGFDYEEVDGGLV